MNFSIKKLLLVNESFAISHDVKEIDEFKEILFIKI